MDRTIKGIGHLFGFWFQPPKLGVTIYPSCSVSPVPSLSTTKRPFGIAFLAMLIALVATLRDLRGKGHRSLA